MNYVHFDSQGRLIGKDGKPMHLVGINYVASYVCTNFWKDWRPDRIEKDLSKIASLGLGAVRIPMHWEYMEPIEGVYNSEFEERFAVFVKMCETYDLYIMPWFLVGVATQDYDVSWRRERSFFGEEMKKAAAEHLIHFIRPYAENKQILFWDICDEPEWYSRHPGADQLPYNKEKFASWVQAMYDAIRSVDTNHRITLGFGHIATSNYGMDLREMSDILDLMVVTAYPPTQEALDHSRQNYTLPFHVKMNSRRKPVFTCEAPGYSSIAYSNEIIGRYYKTSIYSNLLNGSTGVLPWVYNDFEKEIWHEKPLDVYTIEPGFGIVTVDGELKPCGKELADYARFAREYNIGNFQPVSARAAILLPDAYQQNAGWCQTVLFHTFQYAKGCGMDVDFIYADDNPEDYDLLIVVTTAGMTTPTWDKLRRYTENGGTLFFQYDYTMLNAYFAALFGVETQTLDMDIHFTSMTAETDFGMWKKGDVISLKGCGNSSVLRVKPVTAKVLCTFDAEIPALLDHEYGKGHAYLCLAPVFSQSAQLSYKDFLYHTAVPLLDAVAESAEILRPVRAEHPAIEIGCLIDKEHDEMLVICLNHHNESLETVLTADEKLWTGNSVMTDCDTNAVIAERKIAVSFAPADVKIFRIIPCPSWI